MHGKQAVVDALNHILAHELSAMDVYLQQGRMCGDWGYTKLEERLVHESGDERTHADRLIQRILFLDGEPNVLARVELAIGRNVEEMLSGDLSYELTVAKKLNEAMQLCVDQGDNASRALLEDLLKETESDHIHWLESQLFLINDVGRALYLAQQI